jgi:sporulation protein YlmC with PRC-barrel domain
MYTKLRDYRFDKDIDDIRGSSVYGTTDEKIGTTDEKIGKIDDVVFDSNTGQIRYVVVDTGGWLHSRRFLLLPEELKPSAEHENDFTINLTKPQIERFPALDEKVLEDNEKFAAYEKTYRSSWTEPSANRKPVTNTRFTNFQQEIVENRAVICDRPALRRVS